MKVLIDNGHGSNTKGKRSPDGRLLEYKWAREVAVMLEDALKKRGIDAERITPEETDVPINTRVKRVNKICFLRGASNCILISLHLNAMGVDGKWHDASGWSGWVAPSSSAKSKKLAKYLHIEAVKRGLQGNRCIPTGRYWVGNFGIVRDTKCPAVLTENLFQDNKEEVEFLLTDEGKKEIVDLHVEAIEKYIALYGKDV